MSGHVSSSLSSNVLKDTSLQERQAWNTEIQNSLYCGYKNHYGDISGPASVKIIVLDLSSFPLVMLRPWYSVSCVFSSFQLCVFSSVLSSVSSLYSSFQLCVQFSIVAFSLSCCRVTCHKCSGSVLCHLKFQLISNNC